MTYDEWLEKPYQDHYKEEDRIEKLYDKWFENLSKETQEILEDFEGNRNFNIYDLWYDVYYDEDEEYE
jgi:hypothetical protein